MSARALCAAAAVVTTATAVAGCFMLKTKGCGSGALVELTVYIGTVGGSSPLEDASRLVIEVRELEADGSERVLEVKEAAPVVGPVSLGRVRFTSRMRVQVEALDSAGTVVAYGGSAIHDLELESDDGAVIVSLGAFVTPMSRSVVVVRALDGAGSVMARGRVGHSATVLPDGRVLVIGGGLALDTSGGVDMTTITRSADLYDPDTGLFWPVVDGVGNAPLSTPRAFHTATLVGDGVVLIAGGMNAELGTPTTLFTAERLDWSGCILPAFTEVNQRALCGVFPELNALSAPRARHEATVMPSGLVLMTGGVEVNGATRTVLDTTEVWTMAGGFVPAGGPPMSDERMLHTQTLLPDGGLLVTGGAGMDASGALEVLQSVELYYEGAGWATIGAMATPRAAHRASRGSIAGGAAVVIVSGGFTAVTLAAGFLAPTPLVETFEPGVGFDPARARVITEILDSGLADHASIGLPDGRVVLLGGTAGDTTTSMVVLVSPQGGGPTFEVDALGALLGSRAGAGAVAMPSGQILLMGGYAVAGFAPITYNTAEMYAPRLPR